MQLRKFLILFTILELSLILLADAIARETPTNFKMLVSQQSKETQAPAMDWQLVGTLGQWSTSAPRALSNEVHTISGGTWSASLKPRPKEIFKDRFEVTNPDN